MFTSGEGMSGAALFTFPSAILMVPLSNTEGLGLGPEVSTEGCSTDADCFDSDGTDPERDLLFDLELAPNSSTVL